MSNAMKPIMPKKANKSGLPPFSSEENLLIKLLAILFGALFVSLASGNLGDLVVS